MVDAYDSRLDKMACLYATHLDKVHGIPTVGLRGIRPNGNLHCYGGTTADIPEVENGTTECLSVGIISNLPVRKKKEGASAPSRLVYAECGLPYCLLHTKFALLFLINPCQCLVL